MKQVIGAVVFFSGAIIFGAGVIGGSMNLYGPGPLGCGLGFIILILGWMSFSSDKPIRIEIVSEQEKNDKPEVEGET